MRVSILKYVLFSIVICSFEYAQNELYLERNIINFRNNRVLAYADNQFDLNSFYESTLSLANKLNEYNNDEEEMISIQNTIDSHIKKHKENNTLPNLNNVDKKTKKLIHGLHKEIEEFKKKLDNKGKGDSELAIQPIHDKIIIKKDGNISVSKHENFKQLENYENILESKNYNFKDNYNEITSSGNYRKLKTSLDKKKWINQLLKRLLLLIGTCVVAGVSGGFSITFLILITLISASIAKKLLKHVKFKID
ncbi:fam-b protein [Plasmodium yoelii]|uniref:Fam-b protein n=2 Tax=Plasmodium yoelii TaxID=5861 RepID=A0AAE9WLR0_PLAYO|nr:fam-b protein [Plasmodium yoelii]WBY54845.1 fam-b protein [Plasmodium yoelii yoelii]CDS44101.1 fam-b protein [Plasmodium yoelii]VTZ71842.1 fam-b protein [Plasmodium yoelii]|eukprot:XP_730433.2 fam-b protein [Plasmodium yoelii]